MKLQNFAALAAVIPYVLGFPHLTNFPGYRSLAGLSSPEVIAVMQIFESLPGAQPLPPPISDTSAKLVVDDVHQYVPPGKNDLRGPCPGLNTLANHGYISRTGITTPGDIITAVQEGFNMGPRLAAFLTYSGFIVDGNLLTNMMSIGANTTIDNVLITGLNTHGTFEGDASTTRSDYNLGDNVNFNETLFQVLVDAAKEVGYGYVNIKAAALDRRRRIQDSIERNPSFYYETPRYLGGAGESSFALAMFVSNQSPSTSLPLKLEDARTFFETNKFPEGFHRRQAPYDFAQIGVLSHEINQLVGIPPGHNEGVNNYVVNPDDPATPCYAYQKQANKVVSLYGPDPPQPLKNAIKANLVTFYYTLGDPTCAQVFPYGK